jgi:cold shock protein
MSSDAQSVIRETEGLVKWFDPKKGYGFIIGPEGQDIFVHYSKIDGDGFRILKDGSTVLYDAELTDKGWHASRVKRSEVAEVAVPLRRGYARSPRR